MIICPHCGRVRIKPGLRMRRMQGDRTLHEETWAKLFDRDPIVDAQDEGITEELRIIATYELCPECEKRAPAVDDM